MPRTPNNSSSAQSDLLITKILFFIGTLSVAVPIVVYAATSIFSIDLDSTPEGDASFIGLYFIPPIALAAICFGTLLLFKGLRFRNFVSSSSKALGIAVLVLTLIVVTLGVVFGYMIEEQASELYLCDTPDEMLCLEPTDELDTELYDLGR